jgi:hypothetical protein
MTLRVLDSFGTLRVVGLRSAFWYSVYRIEKKTGISRWRTPAQSWDEVLARLPRKAMDWNPGARPAFFFDDPKSNGDLLRGIAPDAEAGLTSEIDAIRKGSYPLWEDEYHAMGFPPVWNRNPLTGRSAPADRHWTAIREESTGDIKGLWELSRFSLSFRLARAYARTGNERAPEAFWQLVESWMEANPPNAGPQWISSQEAALRAMAWIFALHAFSRSAATTAARTERMLTALDAHARRIEATLAYARAQNNNHLISEAAGLFTIGLLFPQFPDAARRIAKGRALLEGTAGQFFPDGGYIQHSMNYHRLALQLYLWAMRLAEIHNRPFSRTMYSCVDRSLELLSGLVDLETGRMPNFGHNDGALFLPLNGCEYEDYRPLLQALSLWRKGARIWTAGCWDEDAVWMLGPGFVDCAARLSPEESEQTKKSLSAPRAGLFVLRGNESRAVIRCARFHERPAHADQLQADLWWRGENIACDAGSYLYSGDAPWENSLTHAAIHNTVTIDGSDQMRRAGRFGWATLAQAHGEFHGDAMWQGSHNGYRALGVNHRRLVERMDEDQWIVTDVLAGKGRHEVRLHWLIPDYPWRAMEPQMDHGLQGILMKRQLGRKEDYSGGWIFHTPAGDVSLQIWSNRKGEWTLYRAAEPLRAPAEENGPVPSEIRGWRSLRYAKKIPGLSIAGRTVADFPIRFISVWSPYPDRKP